MLTGFNTDVKFNGKIYHVQTEDRGDENPILESLVYVKGQILDSVQTAYSKRFTGGLNPDVLAGMLEEQHKRVIRSIKNGKYDPSGVKPFGHGIISERPLDEVIVQFLGEQVARETVEVQVEELGDLAPGWTGALRVTVRTDILNQPQRGCPVIIRMATSPSGRPLFRGTTDSEGKVLAEVTLPDTPARGELLVLVETGAGEKQARVPFGAR